MFLTRREYSHLLDRIETLEAQLRDSTQVYVGPGGIWPPETAPVVDVVNALVRHLGVEIWIQFARPKTYRVRAARKDDAP